MITDLRFTATRNQAFIVGHPAEFAQMAVADIDWAINAAADKKTS
jgi:hypothetical protein